MNDIEQQELKKENESLKEEIRLLKKKTELLSITQPLNKLSQFLIDRMDAIIFIKDVTNDFRYFMVNQKKMDTETMSIILLTSSFILLL